MTLTQTTAADIAPLQDLLDRIALFPGEMLPDMIASYLNGDTMQLWLTLREGDKPLGFCFAEPEQLTEGTWNMRAIGVAADAQRSGHGATIVSGLEARLRDLGARLLIVDTASSEELAPARGLYRKLGYAEEARIRDFWAPGEDKIVYWKALS
ncbi:N-acetylglutamate synthase-like GNAT family acetyltransferase [Litoreibacter ponti]|uniref:N-acetylglutamate synthase-like GNAT family acetyltransferase n=1 Tax=Litoreibacter ponti TaxID=1510457 RepID=A0A2T6BHZ6_9RHOB|nr:GNAT family N-acetyltransferase [Litoreibacter ponti]PTX55679.1 N-acetylglutamate synthase-like GNAT family acetyltransferase [Litoreibacter ponti]